MEISSDVRDAQHASRHANLKVPWIYYVWAEMIVGVSMINTQVAFTHTNVENFYRTITIGTGLMCGTITGAKRFLYVPLCVPHRSNKFTPSRDPVEIARGSKVVDWSYDILWEYLSRRLEWSPYCLPIVLSLLTMLPKFSSGYFEYLVLLVKSFTLSNLDRPYHCPVNECQCTM